MSAQQKKADEVMGMVQDRQAREKSVVDHDLCECGHFEMNHANYANFPRACNQTHCLCRHYVAKPIPPLEAPTYKTNALSSEDWTPISVPGRHDIKAGRLQAGKVQYLVRIEGMEDYVLDDLEPSAYVLAILEAGYWQKRAWEAERELQQAWTLIGRSIPCLATLDENRQASEVLEDMRKYALNEKGTTNG
jgi:hypothetical protein